MLNFWLIFTAPAKSRSEQCVAKLKDPIIAQKKAALFSVG